jgi:TolB protein
MDIDPGQAVKTLNSAGGYDAFLVTLDGSGNYVGHITVNGQGDETGGPLAWDPDENLLTAYGFSGTRVDFDPGQGSCYLTSKGGMDLALIRYNLPSLKPYMGQTCPRTTIRRFPPDNMEMLSVANTWWWHGAPVFSPDQKEMFFTKYFDAASRIELWYTKLVGTRWTLPVAAPFGNRTVTEGNPVFSPSGDTLWFFSARNGAGGIFQTVKLPNGTWSAPTQLNVPIPSGYNMGWTFSMANNRNLYLDLFNSQTQGDISLFQWNGDHYLDPVPLPSEINTSYGDNASFISPDEDFLLFASNRPGSAGLHDLYVSYKNPDNGWTQAQNLGSGINAGHEDAFPWISPDGKFLFYNSARTGDLGYNPYWVSTALIEQLKPLPQEAAGPIAFVSTRDGNAEIYSMLDNGSHIQRLTDSESDDLFPAWAPGGDQLAFISDRDGKMDLFVMQSDGTNQHKILESNLLAGSPCWSPDGGHILFTLSEEEDQEESVICIIHPDGTGFQQLDDAGTGSGPVWSHDGKRILFSSKSAGIFQIFSFDPEEVTLTQITRSEINKIHPRPSPDGNLIAYTEPGRTVYPAYLRVINMDGSDDRVLSDLNNSREYPCWSQDGETLYYQSSRFENLEIYSVDLNGRFQTNLTRNPDDDSYPAIPAKKITSGIVEKAFNVTEKVDVWPVPATNELNITISGSGEQEILATLTDITGKVTCKKVAGVMASGTLTARIDLAGLEPGPYLLRIQFNDHIITKQIIKE